MPEVVKKRRQDACESNGPPRISALINAHSTLKRSLLYDNPNHIDLQWLTYH